MSTEAAPGEPATTPSDEPLRCAGALIVDDDGRIFIQRRSPNRRLFPNTWDVAGGHVEPGESLQEAVHREVREETGWNLSHILGLVGEYSYQGDDGLFRVETEFLARVDGDLSRPVLEAGKATEFRWISEAEIDILDEHRDVNDGLMRRIVEDGFATLRMLGL